ncbi:hypothetical protein MB901379_04361 [Mycobacterium basiliense]|uniref:LppP/LprE lipoprotein n=1 Tax=Mycobacterium basiliense TaxID=2094119 RepID=A0A447GJS3_9MYCO|nr:LppP/LprE family lipoprotein [Mycobacterium basiliense]VDM90752.1 hypothetical protein MB901379_04361 [Mycobacterium basiliense]
MSSGEIDPNWPPPAYEPSDAVDTTPPATARRSGRGIWLPVLLGLICVGLVVSVGFVVFVGKRGSIPSPAAPTTVQPNPTSTTSAASNAPGACGPDEAAAVSAALAKLPPDRKTGRPWNPAPESSNYDSCAELSAVVVTVQDSTRSSPDQVLMFHRGAFVGTATSEAYPFTELEAPASTDDLVVLTYRANQSCDTCLDGTLTTVGFQWQADHVQMLDPPPDSLNTPP